MNIETQEKMYNVTPPYHSTEGETPTGYPFRYLKIGRATELTGSDWFLYRVLEIMPAFLAWLTLVGILFLSIFAPTYASYFIIAFAFYWLLKTIYLSIHLRYNWARLKYNLKRDWVGELANLKNEHVYHLVLLPYYREPYEIVEAGMKALLTSTYRKDRMLIVLAYEERAGAEAAAIARRLEVEYGSQFAAFISVSHPENIPGEMAGKGSNIAWAAEESRKSLLDARSIPYKDVLVSAFDVDSVIYPQYFDCLTWHFLTTPDPQHASFQPVPVFHNNIFEAMSLSRVVAISSTFWEMIQQERPERMSTFSSHSMPFQALYDVRYWQTNMVSEDSRIFWNLFIAHHGNYRVVPLSYPISMDANVAPSFWPTVKQIYLQHRRWTYGTENLPYTVFNFYKNKRIPLGRRIRVGLTQLEGYWSLSTNPLMLFVMGWLPLFVGGRAFTETILSYNLAILVRNLMTFSMFGLLISAFISIRMLIVCAEPLKKPRKVKFQFWVLMALQWILVPMTMILFSAIPGLDAQTRLAFGRYMGFWVTPKHVLKATLKATQKGS